MIESVFGLVGNSCYLLIPCSCVLTCSEDSCVWNGLDMRRHVNGLPSVRGERLDAVFWLDRTCICNVVFACFVPHNILGKFVTARNAVNKQASMRICEALSLLFCWIIFRYFSACCACLKEFQAKSQESEFNITVHVKLVLECGMLINLNRTVSMYSTACDDGCILAGNSESFIWKQTGCARPRLCS